MYKIVFIDLDGTLLNPYGIVTEKSKQAIKETMNNGIDVIIASGRTGIDYLKDISSEIGSKNYFIAGNGALIYDIKNDKIMQKKYLSKSKVLEIIAECEKNSIFYNVYTKNSVITKSLNYNSLYYHKENLKKEESKRTVINVVEDPYSYILNLNEDDFLKMAICDKNEAIFNSMIRKLRKIKDIVVLDVSHISRKMIKQGTEDFEIEYYYTEISMQGVNKWDAICDLINVLNIKPEEVIAIGDNINDYKMIKNSGYGIAMGESMPSVKEVAKYVTDDNDSEGVAKALKNVTEMLQRY